MRRILHTILIALLTLSAGVTVPAQLRVQTVGEHPGEVSLRLMLRKLHSVGTYMETTAHPDDENNALLAELGLGEGMRTALVTATRGDGGQNEIGPEIFQALGVLRTEELHAAHRIDGAEQYFTRAIDFGYSFSVEETLERWGPEEILGDFVRHIRAIRPDVIVGFICGGAGGGQHHQATARLTVEAFRAAADPARFPEQLKDGLRPWQASRVFCTDASGFGPKPAQASGPDQVLVPASRFDPLLGRTYGEIGTEARSMHKCQGMSQLLPLPGGAPGRVYRLRDSTLGGPGVAPKTLFEGIDTRLVGLARFAGARPPADLTRGLEAIAGHVTAAESAIATSGQQGAAPALSAGLQATRQLRAALDGLGLDEASRYEIDFRLAQKARQFQEALALSLGLRVEALADDGLVVGGQPVRVTITAGANVEGGALAGVRFEGFEGEAGTCGGELRPGAAITCPADLRIPADVPLSTPYWTPRADAARYDFEPGVPFGLPFRPSPFRATFTVRVAGAEIELDRIVQYRYGDLLAGEKRMELTVVPFHAVRVSPDIAVIPATAAAAGGAAAERTVDVTVINHDKRGGAATVRLQAPDGWQAAPASASARFTREDEAVTVSFRLRPPAAAAPGEVRVTAVAEREGDRARSGEGYTVIEYPHTRRRHVVEPAAARVKIIDVTLPRRLRVGYIAGVGDQVPQAIEQLGAEVRFIERAELAAGDLSQYDAIVTGVRAYERREDLRAHNHRLLTYVENGGTVLVNYNKFEFNEAQYGPWPAKNTSARVTDENAPIEVLVPGHPVFNTPNRLGPETWRGWVQERGTYFLTDTDPRYEHLVEATDPFPYNPGARRGALVYAAHGKGHWVYLGLGLWRQLPAGTDGAYRLMANLLSLGAVSR